MEKVGKKKSTYTTRKIKFCPVNKREKTRKIVLEFSFATAREKKV